MNKEFIPYEQALELKELGFDNKCLAWYQKLPMLIPILIIGTKTSDFYKRIRVLIKYNIQAPLYQQAFRFFREEHGLFSAVNVDQTMEPKFCYSVSRYAENSDWAILVFNSDLYYTYEEAELALLRRLIQTVKEK